MLQYLKIGDHGNNKDKFIKLINRRAGKGNWFWSFKAGEKLYSWDWGMQLYEDAYLQYICQDISLVKELVSYLDVYEVDRYDIDSKLNYRKQTRERDHFQDIAIRRCLVRLGVWFKGNDLLEIKDSKFDHSKITFHLPHLMKSESKSIKSWLDNNRYVVIAMEIQDKAKLADMLIN